MQEQVTVNISSSAISALQTDGADVNAIVLTELENHTKAITDMLTGYHWSERGAVYGVTIEPASVKMSSITQGGFKVIYGTNVHYGCSDVSVSLDHSMQVTIRINLNKGTATLIGELIPEREPDGY